MLTNLTHLFAQIKLKYYKKLRQIHAGACMLLKRDEKLDQQFIKQRNIKWFKILINSISQKHENIIHELNITTKEEQRNRKIVPNKN